MSEELKKYLPWIIGGVVILYFVARAMKGGGGGGPAPTAPQTQITQTPQTDPLAMLRGQAFQALTQFDLGAIQAEAETARANAALALAQQQQNLQYQLGAQQISASVDIANAQSQAQQQAAQNTYNSQIFQQQAQANALKQYYSAINQRSILGSINNAIGTIFGGGGGLGNIFGTGTDGIFSGSGGGGIFY